MDSSPLSEDTKQSLVFKKLTGPSAILIIDKVIRAISIISGINSTMSRWLRLVCCVWLMLASPQHQRRYLHPNALPHLRNRRPGMKWQSEVDQMRARDKETSAQNAHDSIPIRRTRSQSLRCALWPVSRPWISDECKGPSLLFFLQDNIESIFIEVDSLFVTAGSFLSTGCVMLPDSRRPVEYIELKPGKRKNQTWAQPFSLTAKSS